MKFFAISAALATAVSAVPLVAYGANPSALVAPGGKLDAKLDKVQIGGFSTPGTVSSTLNTKTVPINYGNLNLGTGLIPSQVVHYGTENQPDHGHISPHLISTTAQEASFQLAEAEEAKGHLLNADLDAAHLHHKGPFSLIDEDEDSKFAPWWYGRYGRYGRPWGPWGPWGRPWYRRYPIYY